MLNSLPYQINQGVSEAVEQRPTDVSYSPILDLPEHIFNLEWPIEKKAVMDQVLENEAQTDEQKDFVYFAQRHRKPSAQTFF